MVTLTGASFSTCLSPRSLEEASQSPRNPSPLNGWMRNAKIFVRACKGSLDLISVVFFRVMSLLMPLKSLQIETAWLRLQNAFLNISGKWHREKRNLDREELEAKIQSLEKKNLQASAQITSLSRQAKRDQATIRELQEQVQRSSPPQHYEEERALLHEQIEILQEKEASLIQTLRKLQIRQTALEKASSTQQAPNGTDPLQQALETWKQFEAEKQSHLRTLFPEDDSDVQLAQTTNLILATLEKQKKTICEQIEAARQLSQGPLRSALDALLFVITIEAGELEKYQQLVNVHTLTPHTPRSKQLTYIM